LNLITMETTVTSKFIILSIHPDNGKIVIDNTHLKYSLIGAVLLDYLDNYEISIINKMLVPSFRKNGELVHDMFIEKIESYSRLRRVSRWVNSLSGKGWFVFRETVNSLINKGIIRHERRLFLKFFPYNRFFHAERGVRTGIIDEIREVLLNGKPATRKQIMLIALINASRSSNLLTKEGEKRWIIRKKCKEYMKADTMPSDIIKAIKEVQKAITDSITAATSSDNPATI
jgi:hypothetical protein